MLLLACLAAIGLARVYPIPAGEPASDAFAVTVQGKKSFVNIARVAPSDSAAREESLSGKGYDQAAFTGFDMEGTVRVEVAVREDIRSVRVLPTSAGIVPRVEGKRLFFQMKTPRPLTVEVNGDWCRSLHVFANPFEKDVPKKDDPNVLYFGPGVHEIGHLVVGDGKALYLAGGAVLRCVVKPDEPGWTDPNGEKGYPASIELQGKNVALRGRGIIDASRVPLHARNVVGIKAQGALLEGVVLRDAATWNVPIRQSDGVRVENLKILGYRANSDGLDVCNSRDVAIRDCFLRTRDDLIVVKSDQGQGKVHNVSAKNCVLWNELAHALSLGAELREDVDDVRFSDCDIIHDKGREWALRVFHCDSARITNVRFEHIRVEEGRRLASLWIGETSWTRDAARGHVSDVVFRDIRTGDPAAQIEVKGHGDANRVENVLFENVFLGKRRLSPTDIDRNAFTKDVSVRPNL